MEQKVNPARDELMGEIEDSVISQSFQGSPISGQIGVGCSRGW